jgi:glycerol-3-phosphate dehydrogenase subunit C
MTVTYDPHHPKYLDESDLRDELTRVYDLCHGCRLCFKFCSSFPTLFAFIDRHDDQDASKLTKAEQDQVVDECFQCKLCYINCPYTPGQHEWELDFPRLMLRAEAMRHADRDVPTKRRVTDKVMGRTDLVGKLASTMATASNAVTSKRGGITRRVMAAATGI